MRPDLLWRSSLWLLLASGSALAADASAISPGAPPREFWLYYAEFGDSRGELLDPLDYSEASRLQHRPATQQRPESDEQIPHQAAPQASAPGQPEEESDERAQ